MLNSKSAILLSLFFGIVATPGWYLHAQQRDRLITGIRMGPPDGSPTPTQHSPVEVVGFDLAGVPVTVGEPFRADEDWLKGLRAKVKNISEKPILYLRIIFALPEARFVEEGRTYGMGFTLEYKAGAKATNGDSASKVVAPGDEVELVYFESARLPLRQEIASRTGVTSITMLQYGGDVNVFFVDGSVWRGRNVPVGKGMKPKD